MKPSTTSTGQISLMRMEMAGAPGLPVEEVMEAETGLDAVGVGVDAEGAEAVVAGDVEGVVEAAGARKLHIKFI